MNFPTLNLEIPEQFVYEEGIYAGWVYLDGEKHPAAFHYGPIPAFNDFAVSLEVFVIDKVISVQPTVVDFEMQKRIRDILNFDTKDLLAHQMALDVKQTKIILGVQ
ncbi:MAG TPA: riboflavin kinase [Candidatus Paceibacterota bacterium]